MPTPHTRALAGALLRDALDGRGEDARPRLVPLAGGAPAALRDGLTIGRGRAAALRLAAPEISRVHARVVAGRDGFAIEDAGSKNGVAVNGVRAEGAAPLRDGDFVEVGGVRLRVAGIRDPDPELDSDRARRLAAAALLLAGAGALLAAALG